MSPHLSEETGRVLGGRYRLMTPIGSGSSSRVYLAVDTQLRRRVAVKLLHEGLAEDQAFLKRFRAEARAAGALNHPNIVSVFDWGEDESDGLSVPYLVTEFLGGGSLRDILDRGISLSPSQTLIVGLQAARALSHAHQRGLVHRDVKPGNLLFDADGRLRLADFGLARALAEASWTEPIGSVPGTTRYVSPEQASGRRVDGRSDVYSLALVLVECATGQVPFAGETTASTLAQRTHNDLELDASMGPLRSVLEHAGRLEPENRPEAAVFEIALMAAAEDLPQPEPLPIVSTLGSDEGTSEMFLAPEVEVISKNSEDRTKSALAPIKDPVVIGDDEAEVAYFAPPAVDTEPKFAETVPGETTQAALVASRPTSFGPVEPLVTSDESTTSSPRRPKRRRFFLALLVLALLAGASAAWWFLVRVPTHDVPTFVGITVDQAKQRAGALNFVVDSTVENRKDGTKPGEILAQNPPSGTQLSEGETIHLTVSLGPTLTAFPALNGKTRDEAVSAIQTAGLVLGTETTTHDEKVASGTVINGAPAANQPAPDDQSRLPKGTVIDLVISEGPAPRIVPEGLVGASAEDARAALQKLQLKASITEAYDEKVPAGEIISSDTKTGASVARGSSIGLVMSKGPAPIAVPDVRWVSGLVASERLEKAGFTIAGIEGPPSGMVLQTDPTPGELLARGTAVRIFTKK